MLKIATYNIQFSLNQDSIEKNIIKIVDGGVSIICLQEVIIHGNDSNIIARILNKLGTNWSSACHVGNSQDVLSMGTCIMWNKKVVENLEVTKMTLPFSERLSFPEKVFSVLAGGISTPFLRRAISVAFKFERKHIRITNIHLDHNGGRSNRKKQLQYLADELEKNTDFDFEVVCGDFNNLDISKENREEKIFSSVLHAFTDATKNITWTADLYYIDSTSGNILLQKIIRLLHIHLTKKLDYIWIKNVKHESSARLFLKGSDHFPIVASLTAMV